MKNQQLIQRVKSAIYGYRGPHKWAVASKFVESLTDHEQRVFVTTYQSRLKETGDVEDALYAAARPYRMKYNIAASLLSGRP